MDQKVETTTPTTRAGGAIASMVVATLSNLRMSGSPAEGIVGTTYIVMIATARNFVTRDYHCVSRNRNGRIALAAVGTGTVRQSACPAAQPLAQAHWKL